MVYDKKYRQRALDYWKDSHTKLETAEVFKVGTTTLQQWKIQLKETGNLTAKKRRETWRKIDPERLKHYLKEHPDAYLREIAAEFSCSENSVFNALKRLNITRKKNDTVQGKGRKYTTNLP